MSFLRSWARGLVYASILAAVVRQLGEKSPVKKVIDFVCGAVMLGLLISPLLNADREAFSDTMSGYRAAAATVTEDAAEREKQLLRTYIEQKCAAYILDEAAALGAELSSAAVRARWNGEYWVPREAYLNGNVTPEQRVRLSGCLESELGIPPERQHWNEQDRSG